MRERWPGVKHRLDGWHVRKDGEFLSTKTVYNHFAAKMVAFSNHGMTSRLQIAILHFNENSDREQATLQDGRERFNIAFPKYKKGEHAVKKILVKCTYGEYVVNLKESVVRILQGTESSVLVRADAPRSLSSNYGRPEKKAAVIALKSRFRK
ncbi:uncharacterized protein LOC110050582 [Orbicella faveolata]|uniref:uncharacterized protein LOC110050582 n=1 Tax=Orbicella faveolata TaxID=48498 RepID=UPI0009E56A57|nr:uncharacterized protein LOC110050582 [Orbicella faveolata]